MTLNNFNVFTHSNFILRDRSSLTDFERVKKSVLLTLVKLSCFLDGRFLNGCLLTLNKCTHCFLHVYMFVICQSLFSSVRICMNVKTSKVSIFLFVKNIATFIIFDWIMNTKCFINIYHHNTINYFG